MKPSRIKTLLFFAIAVLLSACSNEIQVHTDYDPDYDLWTYKTFDWGQKVEIEAGKNPLHYNELNDKRIKNAVQNQLTSRGFDLTETNPDLILHYHIIVQDKSALVTDPDQYNYSSYWTRMASVYSYREGTLILDLMDAKTKNLIWRGWAVSPVNSSYKPEEIEKLINTAVAKIFRKFPKAPNRKVANDDVALN